MKYLKPQKTSSIQIVILTIVAFLLIALSIGLDFTNEVYEFFLSYMTLPTTRNLVNIIFLVMVGMLFFAYRKWLVASRREQELSAVVEGINPDTLVVTDSCGEIQLCSRAIVRMFGYKSDELIGSPIDRIIVPISQNPGKLPGVIESMKNEGFNISLSKAIRKDGSEFPAEVISAGLRSNLGEAVLIRDITERIDFQDRIFQYNTRLEELVDERTKELQRTKDSLIREVNEHRRSKSEIQNLSQFHQSIIDNASVWVSVYDIKKGIVLWNKAAEEISGFSKEEVFNNPKILDIFYEDDIAELAKMRRKESLKNGTEIDDFETTITTKHGEKVTLLWSTRNLLDMNSEVSSIIYIGRDITQERAAGLQAEQRLAEMKFLSDSSMAFMKIRSEELLFNFLAHGLSSINKDSIIIVNRFDSVNKEFKIRAWANLEPIRAEIKNQIGIDILELSFPVNDEAAIDPLLSNRLIRFPSEGDINMLSFGRIPPEFSRHLARKFNLGFIYLIGFSWEGKIYASANILTKRDNIIDHPGVVESFAHLGSVVLRRIESENELIEAKFAAEKANSAKTQFLANMSHEIRTPLNGLLGMTEVTLRSELPPEQRENIRIAYDSGRDLLKIVNNILDLSKIEAGEMKLAQEEFSLREMIGNIHQKMVVLARKKSIKFTIEIDPAVPDLIIGDSFRLEQVLMNLVSNAIKFTDEGSVMLSAVPMKSDDPSKVSVKFSVVDTGIGIPKDKLGLIFESYQQADSSIKHKKGTGLGVAIAKSIVILMDGDIEVDSEEGLGSDFHFTVSFKLPGREK